MNIGVDLIAETSVSVDPTTYFSLRLDLNGQAVPLSQGSDRWDLNGMILPGRRVAATGRSAAYTTFDTYTGIGFGPMQAQGAVPCPLNVGPGDSLVVVVDNNAVLDPGLFCMDFSFQVALDGEGSSRRLDISLRRPDVKMSWPSRGLFRFDITSALAP